MKKIKAYTLIELTVVMILIGLLVTAGAMAFSLVNKQIFRYGNAATLVIEKYRFDALLRKDMEGALTVRRLNKNELLFEKISGDVQYKLHDGFVVRKMKGSTDTVNIDTKRMEYYLMGKEQNSYRGLIDEIELITLTDKGLQQPYRLTKQYGADFLIQLTEEKE